MTIDPKLAQAAWQYIGAPVRDPAGDATLQQLLAGGYLQQSRGDSEGQGAQYDWSPGISQDPLGSHLSSLGVTSSYGSADPNNPNMAANPALRLVNADNIGVQGTDQTLRNPDAVLKGTDFGNLTPVGNIDNHESGLNKVFWQVAPLIPALAATVFTGGAAAPLLGELADGGASAGAIGGAGTFAGLGSDFAATAGSLPSWMAQLGLTPSQLTSMVKGLGSSVQQGKFDLNSLLPTIAGVGGAAAGIPNWASPIIAQAASGKAPTPLGAGMTLAKLLGGTGG